MVTYSHFHHASGVVLEEDTLARLTIQLTRGRPCMLLSCKFHYLIWVLAMVLKEGGGVKAAGRARAGSVRIISKGCSKLRTSLCFSKESEAGRVG